MALSFTTLISDSSFLPAVARKRQNNKPKKTEEKPGKVASCILDLTSATQNMIRERDKENEELREKVKSLINNSPEKKHIEENEELKKVNKLTSQKLRDVCNEMVPLKTKLAATEKKKAELQAKSEELNARVEDITKTVNTLQNRIDDAAITIGCISWLLFTAVLCAAIAIPLIALAVPTGGLSLIGLVGLIVPPFIAAPVGIGIGIMVRDYYKPAEEAQTSSISSNTNTAKDQKKRL